MRAITPIEATTRDEIGPFERMLDEKNGEWWNICETQFTFFVLSVFLFPPLPSSTTSLHPDQPTMKFTAFGLFFIPTVVSFTHTALTSRRLSASALSSTLERVAPSAGVVPQWEEQQGLSEEVSPRAVTRAHDERKQTSEILILNDFLTSLPLPLPLAHPRSSCALICPNLTCPSPSSNVP